MTSIVNYSTMISDVNDPSMISDVNDPAMISIVNDPAMISDPTTIPTQLANYSIEINIYALSV